MKDNYNECSPELYNDATDLEVEKLKEIYMPTALPPYNSLFIIIIIFLSEANLLNSALIIMAVL